TGDSMGDDHPLFSTFKPFGEDNKASTKQAPNRTLAQPLGAEQPPGHRDTHGRVGCGVMKGPSPPGSWPFPPEEDLQPELVALRARTKLWFEQTQARRLRAEGELPAWFHGFISRRETEQLLQDQPQGCFLVRFSESTVGFVLSYRGRDRCRHFVLDQQPDGQYVILGERSAHAELADLLRHYSVSPVTPYHEFLTVPRTRVRIRPLLGPCSRKSGVSCGQQGRSQPASTPRVPHGARLRRSSRRVAPWPRDPREPGRRPRPPPCPQSPAPREPRPGRDKLEEPIPFYAMGRGSSPSQEENIYSEV
ncbi:SH22A protein, partial [Eurystomus gularis]|nr:SH22A protein [Eurystomus gularis]